MAGNSLDLNAEIINSMSPSPIENANRTVDNVLGKHYEFYAIPHLNPSPDEQVAMQQVGPTPNYKMKVTPISDPIRIPNRKWVSGNYVVSHQSGVFTFYQLEPRSFLGFTLKDREQTIYRVRGSNGLWRMISYIDNSSLPTEDKITLTNDLAASSGKKISEVLEKNETTGAFVSPLFYSNDYMPQVDPTGVIDDGLSYGSSYQWGNSISELPDF
tara:strand:- start:4478 stop:5119 length:642 start_codon:yes stop_codon:yes gene_type:complete